VAVAPATKVAAPFQNFNLAGSRMNNPPVERQERHASIATKAQEDSAGRETRTTANAHIAISRAILE
jgi:hypothetical protein